jgi:mannan endo-1,4-beta-mannosidase
MNKLGVYFKTWETNWVSKANEMDLAKVDADIVYISFCKPRFEYSGPGNWTPTGIQLSQEWNVVVEAIDILRANGKTVMLSVGGASYQFDDNTSFDNIVRLCKDMHCDGIDIDWEPNGSDGKTAIQKDWQFSQLIEGFYNADPTLLLSAAVFSTGAYPPQEGDNYKGMNIKGLQQSGNRLDWINVMAYDAGASFDAIAAYNQYKKIFPRTVNVGLQIGKHGWGDGKLTTQDITRIGAAVLPEGDGIFIWGSKKTPGSPSFDEAVALSKTVLAKRPAPTEPDTPNKKPATGSFVQVNGTELSLAGKKFVACGFNAYWLGLTEEYTYPAHDQVIEMFEAAVKMGATTIRSHTLGGSSGNMNSLYHNGTINVTAWPAIDFAMSMAKKYGIRLVVPLTDGYEWYNGNIGHFNPPGVSKDDFWTNTTSRSNFKNYINVYLNHYNPLNGCMIKDDPCIAMIELGNELGNIRPGAKSNSIPTYEWLEDISKYIKTIDRNHLVLSPCDESIGKVGEQSISTIDVNTAHFYWDDQSRLDYAKSFRKPVLVGEVTSKPHWGLDRYDSTCGALAWSMYGHYSSGGQVPHDDGYTFYTESPEFQTWKTYCNRVSPTAPPPIIVPPVVVPPVVVPPVVVPPYVGGPAGTIYMHDIPPTVPGGSISASCEITMVCSNCSVKNVYTL